MDKIDKKKLIIIVGIIAVVLTVILLIIALISRNNGNNDNTGDGGNDNNVGQAVTLEYWGLWEPEGVMDPIIKKYEDANPNIDIVYKQRSFSQYEETLYTRLEKGSSVDTPAPDIFRVNNTWLNKFQPYLSPLPSSIMDQTEYASIFYPTAVNDFTGTDGQIYAVPLEVDGLAIFYNIELFQKAGLKEPPKSWDEMIDVAEQLTIRDASGNIEQFGISLGTGNNITHSADVISLLFLQNGVQINQNNNSEVDITSQEAIDAMNFYTQFITEYDMWDPDIRSDLELFYQGKLAMMFAPSWRAFDIINANPSIEFGITNTPNLPNQTLYYSMYWGEAVSNTSSNPTEAWKFIKYLSEEEQLKEFYNNSIQIAGRAFGEPYSRVSMGDELRNNPYVKPFITMAPDMQAWKMGEQSYIEERLREAATEITVSGENTDKALKSAQDDINRRLSEIIQ